MAKRRKVGNLLALMILANLVEKPAHPYELANLLRERGKDHDIKIKWGSLYTVVQNLEKHGFVEAAGSTRQGRRPERTVYAITEAGLAELKDWVRELISEPEREPTRFQAGLSVVAVIGPDETMTLLAQRLEALTKQVDAQRTALDQYRQWLPRLFLIEAEYDLAIRAAEAEWVRGVLDDLRSGAFPDVESWRRFYQTGVLPPEIAELARRGREPG
jgi:DNA-binding PadR family transcriptional regulator